MSSPALKTAPVAGIEITGALGPRFDEILTPEALAFVADLHRAFNPTRKALLARRTERQVAFDAGTLPDFLPETKSVRDGDWTIADLPADLLDRRVEITGPVDRKMIVNALNSGAKVFMADFEDASSPVWENMIEGQINLKDRWAGAIDFVDANNGKSYKLGANPAVLIIRPRGWHLPEAHVLVDGEEVSGALFDFGLYVFHNAKAALAQGSGPYFYLPKTESHLEARLWNEVFVAAQKALGLPVGTIKATVLIETLPAVFEMDEILFEMKDHIAGLNLGRWDYIFSFIKRLGKNDRFLTPDRSRMVMSEAFLKAYGILLVRTCHRRNAFAMGGMAAQIPVKGDAEANAAAFAKVKADKEREGQFGLRRHLGGPSGPRAGGHGGVQPPDARRQPARRQAQRRGRHPRRPAGGASGHPLGSRPAREHPRRRAVHRGVAARSRRGAALQPHGRCGHRRDQPCAGVAVDPPRRPRWTTTAP